MIWLPKAVRASGLGLKARIFLASSVAGRVQSSHRSERVILGA
jgi:hypothetical protein